MDILTNLRKALGATPKSKARRARRSLLREKVNLWPTLAPHFANRFGTDEGDYWRVQYLRVCARACKRQAQLEASRKREGVKLRVLTLGLALEIIIVLVLHLAQDQSQDLMWALIAGSGVSFITIIIINRRLVQSYNTTTAYRNTFFISIIFVSLVLAIYYNFISPPFSFLIDDFELLAGIYVGLGVGSVTANAFLGVSDWHTLRVSRVGVRVSHPANRYYYLVDSITRAMHILSKWTSIPPRLDARKKLAVELERAAIMLEGLGGTYFEVSRASLTTASGRFIQAAQHVRDLQLWLALPGSSTLSDLKDHIGDLIVTIVSGHYDQLPLSGRPTSLKALNVRSGMSLIYNVLRVLTPLAAVIVVDQWIAAVPPLVYQLVISIALFWLVVGLIMISGVDSASLATAREVFAAVKGNGTPSGDAASADERRKQREQASAASR